MLEPIIWSIVVLAGLGAVFGIMLGVASKKFAVKKDERVDKVRECLPGANCGGCGLPGCDGFADAVVKGEVEVSACAVISAESAKEIGAILGVDVGEHKPKVARIMCLGSTGYNFDKFDYNGAMDCRAVHATAMGHKACRFACLGMGTCAKVCKFGAISMGESGIAHIDEDKCTGCGTCVDQCPKSTISVMDKDINVYAACMNKDKGKPVMEVCKIGCIGCGICAKNCPFEAITMENNLPVIDYEKCRQCKVCVEKCPRKCIVTTQPDKVAVIERKKCIGCTLCKKVCPFEAIEGELKQVHKVTEQCRGCGLCVEACKKEAITLEAKKEKKNLEQTG